MVLTKPFKWHDIETAATNARVVLEGKVSGSGKTWN
jgi:hypothetical protein